MSSGEELRRAGGGLINTAGGLINILTFLFGKADIVLAAWPFVAEWNAITEPWGTPDGLRQRLDVLVRAGKAVAPLTTTTLDDLAVVQLEKVKDSTTLVEFLAGLIAKYGSPAATLAAMEDADQRAAILESAEAANLDLNVIWEAIKLILQIINLLRGGTDEPAGANTNWGF